MFIQFIRLILIPAICMLIAVSSFVLDKEPDQLLLILTGCLFSASVMFYKKIPYSNLLQVLLLSLFHWSSQLNWCQLLYFILIAIATEKTKKFTNLLSISLGYSVLYTTIRLTYLPINEYNLLVSIYDFISFILIVVFLRYFFTSELEKRQLQKRNRFLTTHDPLTRLLNYEGYINSINNLISKKNPIILVLLDFQDFKSINNESISNGNEVLMNISVLLRSYFSNAVAISRYAGDRFALVIPRTENTLNEIVKLLKRNPLGYQVTYSLAQFPEEAQSSQELIALSEDRLFQNKRILWLKNEEELFRSEKMKIVGELAAGMAHEIRNPLTTMQGFMQLSKSQAYNIQPWFDVMMNEITRMNELTGEFLQFSKPHINNIKPESISKCMERVLFLTESQVVSQGHIIHLQSTDESILVEVDRDKMVQVLLNLVRNAIEAMKEPGHIFMLAKRIDKEVIIEIKDTGSGIPESEFANIFNPFYTTKVDGTGIGLSICYKIVQDHGGTLSVHSVIDQGSSFIVKLPAY
ncbi:ATP-binding protein [Cohnella sp.]|uniref:ATP-binding protein n=1 Tax=Cohnella sp. TaxID=1883426 RepID=UPI0035651B3E